jgi:hypothetical protein
MTERLPAGGGGDDVERGWSWCKVECCDMSGVHWGFNGTNLPTITHLNPVSIPQLTTRYYEKYVRVQVN